MGLYAENMRRLIIFFNSKYSISTLNMKVEGFSSTLNKVYRSEKSADSLICLLIIGQD